ncbi:homeodomain transcription factor [Tubulinosema ratisbonensis]|uniref:Homeodomain transcription factor n=1 Tax=Tubulinosema ratisbonensis TaxID=291195 RepID=A0A437AJN6_9MICR|nr:homeodomain transcription factor [Tubulinosema ratisbonensis]
MDLRKKSRPNEKQKKSLWEHFFKNKTPNKPERILLANKLGVSVKYIENWFRNTRANFKNKLKSDNLFGNNVVIVPYCMALLIKPNLTDVEKYIYLVMKGCNVPILIKFNYESKKYSLSYW